MSCAGSVPHRLEGVSRRTQGDVLSERSLRPARRLNQSASGGERRESSAISIGNKGRL